MLGRWFLSAGLAAALVFPAVAAEQPPSIDPDTVPRALGSSTLGGDAALAVIPFALPKIPEDAEIGKKTSWGDPDLSGIFWHHARLFQNPAFSTGVAPGISTAPSALTLHPTLFTDRLGSRGDYHTPILRPWAADMVKRLGDGEAASMPYYERCWMNNGMLVSWSLGNRGVRLVQRRERIYLFFGQDVVRVIHLNEVHPSNLERSVNGHSVGRWEGDTLVVDTIGFDGTSDSDRYGTPTTEELHVVERLHLRHDDQILEIQFWVEDPLVFTQPWTSVITYSRAEKLGLERVCREMLLFPSPY
jgi:hypothetical protein